MKSAIALNLVDTNRFSSIGVNDISTEEQDSIIKLALDLLIDRHKPGQIMTSPEDTAAYLRLRLANKKNECFGVIYLDTHHRVICDEVLFEGTVNSGSVYPRVVVQRALELNGVSLSFYHNHPGGITAPSQADQNITKRLVYALQLVDIRVIDHFIVSGESSTSFALSGLI